MTPGQIHLCFDAAAWTTGSAVAFATGRRFKDVFTRALDHARHPDYVVYLAIGAGCGALAFGTANLWASGIPKFGHSIAGGLAGGIVGVEAYKIRRGLRGSTGLRFVLPLALGIAIGRVGCFLSGIADETYGVEDWITWGRLDEPQVALVEFTRHLDERRAA